LRKSDATQTEIEQAEKTLKDIYVRKKNEMQQILNKFAEFADSEFTIEEAGGSWLGGEEYSFKISIRSKTQEDYNKVLQALSYVAEGLKQDAFIENLGEVNESEVTNEGLLNGDYTPTIHVAFVRAPTAREKALIQQDFTNNSTEDLPLDATITNNEIVFSFPTWMIDENLSNEEKIKAYNTLLDNWQNKINNILKEGKNDRFKDTYTGDFDIRFERSRFHSADSTEGTERDYSGFRNNNFPTTQQQGISEEKGREIRDFSNRVASSRRDSEIQTFTTPQGEVYGFVDKDGNIYLDEAKISPEHPIHEYTHVWDRVVAERNPELWKRGVELMKQTSLWKEISESESYGRLWRKKGITGERLDNLIASEVHARFVGEGGAKLLDDIAKEKGQGNIISKLRQWILDFWKNLKETFGNWSKSDLDKLTLKDFNHMTVRDFAENTLNNMNQTTDSTVQETQEKKFTPEYQLDRSKLESDSRYDKLRSEMSSRTIETRAKHIAYLFTDKVDEMVDDQIDQIDGELTEIERQYLDSHSAGLVSYPKSKRKYVLELEGRLFRLQNAKRTGNRAKMIELLDVNNIFDKIKDDLQKITEISDEDFYDEMDLDPSKKKDFQKMVDNFEALKGYAVYYINMNEGVKIEEEDETDSDDENGERVNGTEGWAFKVRFTDPYSTASAFTKKLLNHIPMLDKNGDVVFDDLGCLVTMMGVYAHSVLMHELASMKNPEDFVVYDADGNPTFPALEALLDKYPWLWDFKEELRVHPEHISTVYNDLRKDFISYWMVKEAKDGKIRLSRMNYSTAREAVLPKLEHNYEYGELQHEDSIFGRDRKIIKENVDKATELLGQASEDLMSYTQDAYQRLQQELTTLLNMLGFSSDVYNTTAFLAGKDALVDTANVLGQIDQILKSADTYKGENFLESNRGYYTNIADKIGIVDEDLAMDSFRQDGKSFYSYSAPNFVNTLIKNLKEMDDEKRKAYMDEHFKKYKWFYDEKTGWKSEWLRRLYDDRKGIVDRSALDIMNLAYINGKYYRDWNDDDMTTAFITAYFADENSDYAWYNMPIFSDSPVANLIKFRKETGFLKDIKGSIANKFVTVVRQELWRQGLIKSRRENKASEIVNFDKNGENTFYFFPELNTFKYTEGEYKGKTFLQVYNELSGSLKKSDPKQFETKLNDAIKSAVTTIMDSNFDAFYKEKVSRLEDTLADTILAADIPKNERSSTFKKKIEEYYWNNAYAQTQIIELTTIDPAFYKKDGGIDFQKRYKEVYAAGGKLNTSLPHSEGGRKYERTVYLSDSIRRSPSYTSIKDVLQKAADKKKFGNDKKIAQACVNDILHKLGDINSTDGQAYRSISSFRSMLKMLGQWTDQMQETFERFKDGRWDMSDFYVVWNTIKPYVFTLDDVPTGADPELYGRRMPVPHQNKNSEFLLLAMHGLLAESAGKSPQMRGLNRFMEDYEIDVAQFESAAKVGGQGIVDITYSRKKLDGILYQKDENGNFILKDGERVPTKNGEIILNNYEGNTDYEKYMNFLDSMLTEGKISQEKYNKYIEYLTPSEDEVYDILKEATTTKNNSQNPYIELEEDPETHRAYNPEVVHRHSYDDYMIAQPTPEHLFDTEAVFGSQIRNLIIADLPADFEITLGNKKYDKDSFLKLYKSIIIENLLDDFEKVRERFDSIEKFQKALEDTVKDNPKYGREVLDAIQLVPDGNGGKKFNIPLNNPSTTMKLQEVVNAMFKNGVTKQHIKGGACVLVSNFGYTNQLHVVYNKEEDKASGVKYAECYLPAWSKKYFTEFMDENGNIDLEKIPDDLKKMIGYRIPTEHKYSILPLKVKGFLPIQNGSSIMLPMETVAFSGEDFDVDKKFLMIPEFEAPGLKDIDKDSSAKGNNGIVKVEYDFSKPVCENTRLQRNNMLIDLMYGILTCPYVAEQILHPRNFDNIKKAAAISRIAYDDELLRVYKRQNCLTDNESIVKALLNSSLDSLEGLLEKHRKQYNYLDPRTFMRFHGQYRTNDILLGIYAKNASCQAKYQDSGIKITPECRFKINGRVIDSVGSMRSITGELISFNCAEFFVAALEDNKNPILCYLFQNAKTAHITTAMLRMGLSIEETGLMFSQPIVREMFNTYGNLDNLNKMIVRYGNVIRKYDSTYKMPEDLSVESEELLTNILNCKILEYVRDLTDNKAGVERTGGFDTIRKLERMVKAAAVMSKILAVANDLNILTSISRSDCPNGSILPSVAHALNQRRRVELFNIWTSRNALAIINTDGLIKNNVGSPDSTVKDLREYFNSCKMPLLQAFYTLGIDIPISIAARYLPMVEKSVICIFNEVSGNSPRGILPDKRYNKRTYTSDMLMKDITTFALSDTRLFGSDGTYSFDQKRDYYIYEFPRKLIELMDENQDLQQVGVLKKLVVKRGKIIVENTEKMSQFTIAHFMAEIDQLLESDNPVAKEVLEGLLKYGYYTEQLNYGPLSFVRFLSPRVLRLFPEYCKALEGVPAKMANPVYRQRFLDQLYGQHAAELLPLVNGTMKGPLLEIDIERIINKNAENMAGEDSLPIFKYVCHRVYDKLADAYVIAPFKFVRQSTDGKVALFEMMPYYKDVDGVRYNAEVSSEKMARKLPDERRYADLQCVYGKSQRVDRRKSVRGQRGRFPVSFRHIVASVDSSFLEKHT
jgi:hypothetical protein